MGSLKRPGDVAADVGMPGKGMSLHDPIVIESDLKDVGIKADTGEDEVWLDGNPEPQRPPKVYARVLCISKVIRNDGALHRIRQIIRRPKSLDDLRKGGLPRYNKGDVLIRNGLIDRDTGDCYEATTIQHRLYENQEAGER